MAERNDTPATRQRLRLAGGTELSFITAGEASRPAVLLLHGTPNSARMFRELLPARVSHRTWPSAFLPNAGKRIGA